MMTCGAVSPIFRFVNESMLSRFVAVIDCVAIIPGSMVVFGFAAAAPTTMRPLLVASRVILRNPSLFMISVMPSNWVCPSPSISVYAV